MTRSKTVGRIRFPGNPWPRGHAVTCFAWTARVERGTGLWFDLHLETEPYRNADGPSARDDGEAEDDAATDWESRTVWCNYHACTLSSTRWAGQCTGFLVATKHEPLDFRTLPRRTFAVDDLPADLTPPRPFHIYLTGHDAVAAHSIRFRRERGKPTYAIDWQGKVALTYAGSDEFKHRFEASVQGIHFGGVAFPGGVDEQEARSLLGPFVSRLPDYRAEVRKRRVHLLPT